MAPSYKNVQGTFPRRVRKMGCSKGITMYGRGGIWPHIDGWTCIMRMGLGLGLGMGLWLGWFVRAWRSQMTPLLTPPRVSLSGFATVLVCLSLSLSLYTPLCLFVCLPGWPRRMCVAFITESHFNHRIFDLLPFDISLQWRRLEGGHVDTFGSDCVSVCGMLQLKSCGLLLPLLVCFCMLCWKSINW